MQGCWHFGITMSRTVNEEEWLHGSPRKVVVKVRRMENERKRLLFLCSIFAQYRHHLVRPALPTAMELVERFADGSVAEAYRARAVGLIRDFDWAPESLPG